MSSHYTREIKSWRRMTITIATGDGGVRGAHLVLPARLDALATPDANAALLLARVAVGAIMARAPTLTVLPAVGQGEANAWGVHDLHGLVWEWVYDFGAALVASDDRERGDADRDKYCGAGAALARDPRQYATFMRLAFRSSLQARYTTANLGFRCAADLPRPGKGP